MQRLLFIPIIFLLLSCEDKQESIDNNAPEFSDIGNQQVDEGEALEFTISATDVESESISISIESHDLPTDPTFTDNNDGTADFSWTSSFGDAGNYNVTFRASDGTDHSDEAILILVGVNQPPVADAGEDGSVNEGENYQLDGSGSFDLDEDLITYSWTSQEEIMLDNENNESPIFTAPYVTENKDYIITLVVSDGFNSSAVDTVTITVLPILYINEFMASNSTMNVDEVGEYDDWLEIYNAGNNSIDLGGFFLTDNVDNLTKWLIPEETIISGSGFLLVWCDEDQEQGVLHTNFKLSIDGEFIALVSSDGFTIIDSISFDIQTEDISFGRISDGNTSWVSFTTPTPNSSNGN